MQLTLLLMLAFQLFSFSFFSVSGLVLFSEHVTKHQTFYACCHHLPGLCKVKDCLRLHVPRPGIFVLQEILCFLGFTYTLPVSNGSYTISINLPVGKHNREVAKCIPSNWIVFVPQPNIRGDCFEYLKERDTFRI